MSASDPQIDSAGCLPALPSSPLGVAHERLESEIHVLLDVAVK
jgi:hypothetical protein